MTTSSTPVGESASSPLSNGYREDDRDRRLIASALQGDSMALETLIRHHQPWIFNIALRMLWNREDAEDATQEILVQVSTNLARFRGESRFRTWAYRIALNHLLGRRRSRAESSISGFDCYGKALDGTRDADWPDERTPSPEAHLLLEEVKIGCMIGMLLCLDRRQRLVFVLGEIFDVSDLLGSRLLGVSRSNFRQALARARRQLYRFLRGQCGLANPANPCRCPRKTRGFIEQGIVDPQRLQFTGTHMRSIAEVAPQRARALQAIEGCDYARLFRDEPFLDPPDFAAALREMTGSGPLREILGLDGR